MRGVSLAIGKDRLASKTGMMCKNEKFSAMAAWETDQMGDHLTRVGRGWIVLSGDGKESRPNNIGFFFERASHLLNNKPVTKVYTQRCQQSTHLRWSMCYLKRLEALSNK